MSIASAAAQKKGLPISIAIAAAAVGANCQPVEPSMSRKMGRILGNVPAPVPAQPLSVNMRCVISINGLGVSVAKAKDKSIEGLLTWVPITATIMNKAIDMIAAIPQGPI